MAPELLVVPEVELDLEQLWTTPAACRPARLRRSTDAAPPRLATSIAVWFDDTCLTVLFSATDDHVVATHLEHDAPLYEEDVFEVFLAPQSLERYFEIEVSPLGTLFDAVIDSPDGVRSTMKADRGWTCEGLTAAVRKVTESNGEQSIDTLVRIPFASLGRERPARGELWRANFFRIDRHPHYADEFSAWQPTLRTPPDFHVASFFGALRFETRGSSFA
ncbi:MAG TPA: carbohydrate-binding family 9-like protein [Thermoanaerobaculia bacterium]